MWYKYIIKSYLEVEIIEGLPYKKVQKDLVRSPSEAKEIFYKHLKKGLNPIILKKIGNNWIEIKIENL